MCLAVEMEKRIMRGELVGGLAGGEEQAAEDFEQTGVEEDLVFRQFARFGEQGHGQEQYRFVGALEAVGVGRAVQAGESGQHGAGCVHALIMRGRGGEGNVERSTFNIERSRKERM